MHLVFFFADPPCVAFSLSDEPIAELLKLCKDNKVFVSAPHTVPRIMDKLISTFIEPECTQPTFLWGHPLIMSPLAKDIKLDSVSAYFSFMSKTCYQYHEG